MDTAYWVEMLGAGGKYGFIVMRQIKDDLAESVTNHFDWSADAWQMARDRAEHRAAHFGMVAVRTGLPDWLPPTPGMVDQTCWLVKEA